MATKIKKGGKNKISNYNKMKIKPSTKTGQRKLRKVFEINRLNKVIPFAKTIGFEDGNINDAYQYLADYYSMIVDEVKIEDKAFLVFTATIKPYWKGKDGTIKYGTTKMENVKKIINVKDKDKEYKKITKNYKFYNPQVMDEWSSMPTGKYDGADFEFTEPEIIPLTMPKKKEMLIKKRYALNKSNYLKNEVWDKGRDMCVVDFIQYRYSPMRNGGRGYNLNKKLKLSVKNFNQEASDKAIEYYSTHDMDGDPVEDLDQNPNKNGYDIEHIDLFCKNMKINMVAIVNNKIIHTGLYKNKKNGTMPSFVFELNSGHLYPVVEKNKVHSWVNKSSGNMVNIKDCDLKAILSDKNEFTPHFKIEEHTKIFDINAGKERDANPLEYQLNLIFKLDTLPTYPYNIKQHNGRLLPLKLNGNMYYCEKETNEMKNIMAYLKYKNRTFTGQCAQNFTAEMLNKNVSIIGLKSTYSPAIAKVLNVENIKNRTHCGLIDEECNKYFEDSEKINSYDINKCYRSCMEDLEVLLQINYDCGMKYYDDEEFNSFKGREVREGLYFIKTDDTKLFHGDNWYSHKIVKLGINEKLISDENIKAHINCFVMKGNPLVDVIKSISDEFSKFKTLKKNAINAIYGWLAKTETKSSEIYVDECCKRIYDNWAGKRGLEDKEVHIQPYFINTNHQWVKDYINNNNFDLDELLEINESKEKFEKIRKFYTYGERQTTKHLDNYLPIAIQIQDEGNIKLYEMIKKTKGKLLYRKTDFACVYGGRKLKLSEEIGGYKKCDNPTLPLPIQKDKSTKLNKYIPKWNDLKYNDSDDYENIINELLNKKGGLLMGSAGVGKSYVIKQGMKILDKKNIKYTSTAFTNKATLQLNGETLHTLLRIDKNNRLGNKWAHALGSKYDVIFVDEISMIKGSIWKLLSQLKTITGIIFILVGDHRQLPPVVDENDEEYTWITDWFNHSVVRDLANENRCELTKRKRFDKPLFDMLNKLWNKDDFSILNNPTKCSKEDLINGTNICYTNKHRKIINEKCMNIRKPNDAILIKYNKKNSESDKQHQDTYLYIDMPLIMFKTSTDKKFKKNELVQCIKYNNNKFTIKNIRDDEMELNISDFHYWVQPGYACTFHKSQGDTYTGLVNIFGTSRMNPNENKRAFYTALSRATKLENIKIRSGFK